MWHISPLHNASKIQLAIPQKRRPDKYKQAMENFYKKIAAAISLHLDLERLKCILVASPGFTRDEFLNFIFQPIEENRKFFTHKQKFLSVHSSSGHVHTKKLRFFHQDPFLIRKKYEL